MKNYEGVYRFTKVVDNEGNEVPIPTKSNPPFVLVDPDVKNPRPMPSRPLGPFTLRLTAVTGKVGTYNLRTRIVNSMGGEVVVTESDDGKNVMNMKCMTMTQAASFDQQKSSLERATKDALTSPMKVWLETEEVVIQAPDGSTIHATRKV